MKNTELDLYTDYLLSSFGSATATGLSEMVQGAVSHDKVTRFLSGRDYTSKDLWMQVKAVVRQVEDETGVLIFDDTIQERSVDRRERLDLLALRPLRGTHSQGN